MWDWYQLPGNDMGGALHIVTDDWNTRDSDLDWCATQDQRWIDGETSTYPAEHLALRDQILAALRELPEADRKTAIRMSETVDRP